MYNYMAESNKKKYIIRPVAESNKKKCLIRPKLLAESYRYREFTVIDIVVWQMFDSPK